MIITAPRKASRDNMRDDKRDERSMQCSYCRTENPE
jgi:hypothetical protein